MQRNRWRLTLLLALLLGALAAPALAEPPASYSPTAADLSAYGLLATATTALEDLETLPAGVDRDSAFYAAIDALTGLWQLHGCEWALPPLAELRSRPGCPPLHVGWSTDGRLKLRIVPLELQNPAFAEYTVLLLTLESNTAGRVELPEAQALRATRIDGGVETAEPLHAAHPLWTQLANLAPTFLPPHSLPGGTTYSYKQLFAGRLDPAALAHVELVWDGGAVRVPYFESD